jgi:predicted DNA-binding transcriptional regulator YafY
MNRVDRLLALILYLQSRRVVTAEEMAQHFELSIRTIYRDLAALGEAGVPIAAEAGVGYTLMKGYNLPPVNFSAEEASALVTAAMLVQQFTDESLRAQMNSALLKVRAVLPRDRQEQIARLESGLATSTTNRLPVQADLSLLQQALAHRRLLRFQYRGSGKTESTERTVEPLGLVYYTQRWHLIAWCRTREDYRDFRADRMTSAAALGETFQPREDFRLSDFVRNANPPSTLTACVQFNTRAADRAKREWGLGIVAEQEVENGSILTLATPEWNGLAFWLLSFGRSATVLSPTTLQKLLTETACELANHHAIHPPDTGLSL